MGKKVLLESGEKAAEQCLKDIEFVFLTKVQSLAGKIRELGITPDHDLLAEIITGDYKQLENKYDEKVQADIEGLTSQILIDQVRQDFHGKLNQVKQYIGTFQSQEIRNLPYNLETLVGVFDVRGNGTIFIPEEMQSFIRRGYEKWLDNPELLKVYIAHEQATNKLQAFYDALKAAGMLDGSLSVKFALIQCFDMWETADTDRVNIKPAKLDYGI